ncbi:MAG: hypothetical protein HYW47_07705 [Deltaproteobacteria bacterium]|nr:hypothetical protein [Deltaproteobacteria bacterium]
MFQSRFSFSIFFLVILAMSLLWVFPQKSWATSQWSRKYNVACMKCHTAFPRLNYYGERFMKNGFQEPDNENPDGSEFRKFTKGNMDLGSLGDYFGARIDFQPLQFVYKDQTVNGGKKNRFEFGKVGWIQLFTAGSIMKNLSFFDELEINSAGTVKHGWLIVGAHNVFDTKLVNFQAGKISPVDWTSFSNRLRNLPEVSGLPDKVTASSGYTATTPAKEDNVNISSGQFGINYYGYKKAFIWALGIGNGTLATDVNQYKNYWGSVKWEVPTDSSDYQGSSISFFAYRGTSTLSTSTAQIKNDFFRLQPSANLRYKDWDVIGSLHYADEKNFTLAASAAPEVYYGGTLIITKMIQDKYYLALQGDLVRQKFKTAGVNNIKESRIVGHASYLIRENVRLILTGIFGFRGALDTASHQAILTVRSMF